MSAASVALSVSSDSEAAARVGGELLPQLGRSLTQPSISPTSLESIRELCAEVLTLLRQDVAKAEALARATLAAAETFGDPEAVALGTRSVANVEFISGEYARAVELHERACGIFASLGNELELAKTLSSCIQPCNLLGFYDRAFEMTERAREIFTRHGERMRLARLDINLGNIYYRQDRFRDALACYRRAYDELCRQDNPEGLAAVLSNLATCYISVNAFTEALRLHQEAREFCHARGMSVLISQADYNIAYLYFLRGDYGEAVSRLRAARLECEQLGHRYQFALCNLDLAELYLEVNLSADAAEMAAAARASFMEMGMGYEAAKALAFNAIAVGQQGSVFEAIKLFNEARASFIAEKNAVWPSLLDLYEALLLFNEGRLCEARRLAAKAQISFAGSGLPSKQAFCSLLLARIALREGETAEARGQCEEAFRTIAELQSPALQYQGHFLSGQVLETSGELNSAYQSYLEARTALDFLRNSLHGEELKIGFLKNRLEVYERLVELCLTGRVSGASADQALAFMEESKSRVLTEMMLRPLTSEPQEESSQSELVNSIRNLREELHWYYSLIEKEQTNPREHSQERISRLQQSARAHEADLARAIKEASVSEAIAAGVVREQSLSAEELRAALPADTALLEYFFVRDRVLACILTRERTEIMPVTVVPRVASLVRALRFQFSKFRLGADYAEQFGKSLLVSAQHHLRSLCGELLQPVRKHLQCERLIVAPHGLLHHVPFHALMEGDCYLMDEYVVSYAPSATAFALCRNSAAAGGFRADAASLLLGVPDENAPGIAEEITALARLLPNSRTFVGAEATYGVLKNLGPGSAIVHIATHGKFRQDNPLFSSIRLGDSYVNVYDLYKLRLPGSLVVLSGCATGLNAVAAGDEMVGLTRGLFHAGARSLLLSLWEVHDQSTSELMAGFYGNLSKGASLGSAIRNAMLKARRRGRTPIFGRRLPSAERADLMRSTAKKIPFLLYQKRLCLHLYADAKEFW